MCGIHVTISAVDDNAKRLSDALTDLLRKRGPDHLGQVETRYGEEDATLHLRFTSTVLALRGDHITQQPFHDPQTGSVLCWNGEAWRIGDKLVGGNDGELLFYRLQGSPISKEQDEHDASCSSTLSVLSVLRSIEGPFAFVYYDAPNARLFFGRDRLGRRSLLLKRSSNERGLTLASAAESTDPSWAEVEADGIYEHSLSQLTKKTTRHDWIANGRAELLVSSIGAFNLNTEQDHCPMTVASPSVGKLRELLKMSLQLRILNIPVPPATGRDGSTRLAVLFSGGLDCTVLARLSHDLLPVDQGVDLINVAFENPRVVAQLAKQASSSTSCYEACPDRITGRKSFAELQSICPQRSWRFVAVNVPYSETLAHKSQVISLIYPHNTEMDLSIAFALYFAARGVGFIGDANDDASRPYTTPARVLLSGLGADELFGGYARHGAAYGRNGYAGLVDELKLDVNRLGKRNLGRDDRAMSHWGREVRFPFLDEQLVKWAIECPVWEKCDFQHPESPECAVEPEKRVLRLLALNLGLKGVALEKKRAIQFGSRTAKMESGKVKGTTVIA